MVEIVCPDCQSRYEVPANALGTTGRKVTCSTCGTVWQARATVEAAAGAFGEADRETDRETRSGDRASAAPRDMAARMARLAERARNTRSGADAPAEEPDEDAAAASRERGQAGRGRSRQMAEIRQMLDAVQKAEERRPRREAARAVPPAPEEPEEPEPQRARGRKGQPPRDRIIDDTSAEAAETEAFLRDRVGLGGQSNRIKQMREGGDTAAERKKLMGRHKRRTIRRQMRERSGTGSGLTGFLFVVLVAGTLTGLYQLHPLIIERLPGTRAPLLEYVAAVDSLRGGVAFEADGLIDRIQQRIAEVRGENAGGGGAASDEAAAQ